MDVIVIGAGLSGLTAAATLRKAGADVQLLEANTHIGGRIRALRDPIGNRALADLGPTWVWPKYQPVVARWLETLGLQTFEQFNDGDAVILGFGPTPVRQALPGQEGMVRIVGGPSALIDALVNRIGHDNIRKSAPVVEVSEEGPGQMAVRLGSGEVITARKVVLSIPLRVAAEAVQLPWATTALVDAMQKTPTWMSTHAKAIALYERPFWREAGLSGRIASRSGPLVEAHDHSGPDGSPAAIFGFVGWPPDIRRRDTDGLNEAILNQLAECFGPEAAHPMDLAVHDWAANPNIVTGLDLSAPANHPDIGPAILRQACLGGRVRFAVSETSEVSPGLIEGALAAGEKAAKDVLALISD